MTGTDTCLQANGTDDEIFIVDDDPDMRDLLALIFTGAGFRAKTFKDGRSVIRATRKTMPACILLDMYLHEELGLDVLKQLGAGQFAAPILILSGRGDIPTAVAAVKNGAFDFLEKQLDAEAIVARVRQTVDTWTCRRPNGIRPTLLRTAVPCLNGLTPREHQVLSHIVGAATNREAAISLGISPRTVETHRARIKRKLGAKNTADLARISLRPGLMP